MTDAIELSGVVAELQGQECLSDVTLTVPAGECVVLMGPSRSGKSLILELCAGLVEPERGTVLVLGRDWARVSAEEEMSLRRRIGTVLQQPGLLSNMTLYNNVALPLRYHGARLGDSEVRRRVVDQLRPLGIEALQDRFPAQLNPGEARCAAIARALVWEPDLLLLDDPIAGLDTDMVKRLGKHLETIKRNRRVTMLLTLRISSPLMDLADRVAEVQAGRVHAIKTRSRVAGSAAAAGQPERSRPDSMTKQQPS